MKQIRRPAGVSLPAKPLAWAAAGLGVIFLALAVFGVQPQKITIAAVRSRREATANPAAPVVLNEMLGRQWGCTVLRKACLDHNRIILHSGHRTPGHPNYTDQPLLGLDLKIITLPGFPEPLGNTFFMPCQFSGQLQYDDPGKKCTLPIRPPTPLDSDDIAHPKSWEEATVPLIFSTPYFNNIAELFLTGIAAFSEMHELGVIPRSAAQFVAYTGGMAVPSFYSNLLAPFSPHPVLSLDEISSRERRGRRCFDAIQVCDPPGLAVVAEDPKTEGKKGFWDLKPKRAGRRIMDYYRDKHPRVFKAARTPPAVFVVTFFIRNDWRRILNLEDVLKRCNAWKPPRASNFTRTQCTAIRPTPETFIDDLARVEVTNAYVGTHGAGGVLAYFLNAGAAFVEVVSWDFCSGWPASYYRVPIEFDKSVATGHFKLKAGPSAVMPGPFERNGTGSAVAYARDRHVRLEFSTLAKALRRIALGNITSTPENRKSRDFAYAEAPPCPVEEDEGR